MTDTHLDRFPVSPLFDVEGAILRTMEDIDLSRAAMPILFRFLNGAINPGKAVRADRPQGSVEEKLETFKKWVHTARTNAPYFINDKSLWEEKHYCLIAAACLPAGDTDAGLNFALNVAEKKPITIYVRQLYSVLQFADTMQGVSPSYFANRGEDVRFICELAACQRAIKIGASLMKDNIAFPKAHMDEKCAGVERFRDVILGNPDKGIQGRTSALSNKFRQSLELYDEMRKTYTSLAGNVRILRPRQS